MKQPIVVQPTTAQLRCDLACALDVLRTIAYSPSCGAAAVGLASDYLREWARHRHCAECGERADFVCADGTLACYNCAQNAGDAS